MFTSGKSANTTATRFVDVLLTPLEKITPPIHARRQITGSSKNPPASATVIGLSLDPGASNMKMVVNARSAAGRVATPHTMLGSIVQMSTPIRGFING